MVPNSYTVNVQVECPEDLAEVVGAKRPPTACPTPRTQKQRLPACRLKQKSQLLFPQVERPGELTEVVGAKRLSDNVSNILARLEGELDEVDSRIGESMHVLDLDNDGLVSTLSPHLKDLTPLQTAGDGRDAPDFAASDKRIC